MKQLFGVYDKKTNNYSDNSADVIQYESSDLRLWIMGRVETKSGINATEEITEILNNHFSEFTEYVAGVYIVVACNLKNKKVAVFHDRTTSHAVMYYTETEDKIYIGTSLKKILCESKIKRELNGNAIEDFITNGFLYGQETLIKNVYKIKAFHSLVLSDGKAEQVKADYPVASMTKGEALDKFKETLDRSVRKCFDGEAEINLPLSSGFDSNYIAYIADNEKNVPVNAFSVGGKFGKNELPIVKNNVECYNNINLHSALTDDNTLQNLPDIVWRLEGSVYEVGLFLQYELARLVEKNQKKYLICGECADQVFNMNYLKKDRFEPDKKDNEVIYYEFSEYPFIFGSYLILKKNGILANSFGIETRYPYLDYELVSIGNSLAEINRKDKRVHVANCRECLPAEIIANMSKIGGSTDCHSLFNSSEEIQSFFKKVESSDLFKKYGEVFKRHSFTESEKQTGTDRTKTAVRNAVLDILHIGKDGRKKSAYFNEEMKIREYMNIAYLIVFEELFIKGNYDMSEIGIKSKLDEIL